MLMLMGFDPAVTQVSYRIGDSITNPLSPLFPYCPVILGFVRRYAPEMGLGSVIANMVSVFRYFYGYLDYPASGMDFPRYSSWPGRRYFLN